MSGEPASGLSRRRYDRIHRRHPQGRRQRVRGEFSRLSRLCFRRARYGRGGAHGWTGFGFARCRHGRGWGDIAAGVEPGRRARARVCSGGDGLYRCGRARGRAPGGQGEHHRAEDDLDTIDRYAKAHGLARSVFLVQAAKAAMRS